jgi:hypothetical protein
MTDRIKDRLVEYGLIACSVIAFLAVVFVVLFISFDYFDRWGILFALAVQLAFIIVLFHFYRWWRYPGIFQSHSATGLFRKIALSILFIWSLPVIALLAHFHLAGLLPLKDMGAYLGLEFPFHTRKRVQISRVVPVQFRPGEVGIVRKVRVVSSSDFFPAPMPVGTALYKVSFPDGVAIEIPEEEIVSEV